MYLFHFQQKEPEEYRKQVESFVSRQPAGKWEFKGNQYTVVNEQYELNTGTNKDLNVPLFTDVYCVKMPDNTDRRKPQTSRPELIGTNFTLHIQEKEKTVKKKENTSYPTRITRLSLEGKFIGQFEKMQKCNSC